MSINPQPLKDMSVVFTHCFWFGVQLVGRVLALILSEVCHRKYDV